MAKTKKISVSAKQAVKKSAAFAPKPKATKQKKAAPAPALVETPAAPAQRETKKAVAISMLAAGCTVSELMERLGWLRHTTRSFISVLGRTRRIGVGTDGDGERTYRLAA